MDNKHQRWQFTAFESNYDVLDAAIAAKSFKEVGWQDEVCPTTGKKHRQGYFVSQTPIRPTAARKLIPGVHVEPAKNFAALKAYCSKEETRDPEGKQVAMSFEATHITVDKFMDLLADAWEGEVVDEDLFDVPGKDPFPGTSGYWKLVKIILADKPYLASLAMAPGPKNLWLATRSVWLRRAEARRKTSSISITDEVPETPGFPGVVVGDVVELEINSIPRV